MYWYVDYICKHKNRRRVDVAQHRTRGKILVCNSSESERAQTVNMRGKKCLDTLAESSFPPYSQLCVNENRRSGKKAASSYSVEVKWLREALVIPFQGSSSGMWLSAIRHRSFLVESTQRWAVSLVARESPVVFVSCTVSMGELFFSRASWPK